MLLTCANGLMPATKIVPTTDVQVLHSDDVEQVVDKGSVPWNSAPEVLLQVGCLGLALSLGLAGKYVLEVPGSPTTSVLPRRSPEHRANSFTTTAHGSGYLSRLDHHVWCPA